MSLRHGTPLWLAQGPAPIETLPLSSDATADVAILGAGITGALLAYTLVRSGFSVIVLDKRPLGTGSTAASTGLLQYEIDVPLLELIEKVGEAPAVHAYRRGLEAINELESLVRSLNADCGFARCDTLYFASHFWHRHRLAQQYECLRHFGFDVEWLDRAGLAEATSIAAAGAIRARGDAQIDPYRLTQALLHQAIAHGAQAYSNTEVLEIAADQSPAVLLTGSHRVTADKIVFATGYDSNRYLRTKLGSLHSTFAVVSEPLKSNAGWPADCLLWETARPYFYARRSEDGRAIIGGEDTSFSSDHYSDRLIEHKAKKLAERFAELFPQIEFIPEFAWGGVFGESADGLAYIGRPPDQPNCYFAIGYGGNGITFSVIAANLIRDQLLRRPNPDAHVFGFERAT
ncbi:MAG TPA: FAD-dependent oxidoreductase [Pirellulales bacterium]|nr:FAD-dependent oxidoreductase [Pirellulales bacterium]